MHGRGGVVRIQEDTGESIKVYSLEEWNIELAKRAKEATKKKVADTPVDSGVDTHLPTETKTTDEPVLGATKKVATKKVKKS